VVSTQKTFTIPLRKGFQEAAPYKRAPKAMRVLRSFLQRHCKVDEVKIGPRLNQLIWQRGIRSPPPRVTVNVIIDDGVAKAELEGFTYVDAPKPVEKKDESLKDKLASKLTGGKDSKPVEKEEQAEDSSSSS